MARSSPARYSPGRQYRPSQPAHQEIFARELEQLEEGVICVRDGAGIVSTDDADHVRLDELAQAFLADAQRLRHPDMLRHLEGRPDGADGASRPLRETPRQIDPREYQHRAPAFEGQHPSVPIDDPRFGPVRDQVKQYRAGKASGLKGVKAERRCAFSSERTARSRERPLQ